VLASLGGQLVNATSLEALKERIINMTRKLVAGKIDLWLREDLFRLPDWDQETVFPEQPDLDGISAVLRSGQQQVQNDTAREIYAALPLEDQNLLLGALQVSRENGELFQPAELDVLTGLASIISVGLYASHRVVIERLRLNQLHLVSEVSAQIANVMDIGELSERITELIQKSFNYYYVGIFTREPENPILRFRSGSSTPRRGRPRKQVQLEVQIGQGLIGQAAQSGERILVDDVTGDERFRFIPSLPGTKSEIVLPLKIKDRVFGVLDVQSDKLNGFHPNDILVLDALAANIARAVEGAYLYSDLHRRADQLAVISEVSEKITSTLDLTELMRTTAVLIQKKFNYPFVHLFTVHPNRRQIIFEAGSGTRRKKLQGAVLSLDESKGIIPWVARNGKSILANDVSKDIHYIESPFARKDTHSELCVPLIFDNNVVGILDVQSNEIGAFSKDDQVIFEAVADNIAAAIHNADLFHSEQWRRKVADSLREVAVLLSANVGVEQVLDAILTELENTLPIDISAIWLFEDGDLRLAAVHGCEKEVLVNARKDAPEASVAIMAALISDDPVIRKVSDPKWLSGLAAGFNVDYSSIAAPLKVGDQPLGVLTLAHHTSGRYGHEAQAMTRTFASYASVAIENARLYDAAQEQAYASAALLQVAHAVVSLNDLDEILGTIIRIMPILVGVEQILLYLWDSENETFSPYEEYGLIEDDEIDFWQSDFSIQSSRLVKAACESGRLLALHVNFHDSPLLWLDYQPLNDAEEHLALSSPKELLYAVPLFIKNDLLGVMLIQEAPGGLRFRTRRLDIINGIAQQAALAIQNDLFQAEVVVRERLETEIQLARQIQQTFLPDKLPVLEGWDLAARWLTARQVGGDFYDVIELPGDRIGLFIADVADKGIPAAIFMALTRTLVRAAVVETDSPAEALRRVNDLLIPDTHQGMFVTAVYAVLYPDTGELVYANAGHNPPFWLNREGSIESLTRTAMALGVVAGTEVKEQKIELNPEDILLFYTDGLSESIGHDGEFYGEDRILDLLTNNSGQSAEAILQSIENNLDEFVGEEIQSDDLTLLLLRRQ
jgi:serine phosphatase RsbU (regulator of sigma subunit)/putative methionine-R-sulfoxide reductase with GAF domain